jgi:tetratricopeptide (TPR) repeat protein
MASDTSGVNLLSNISFGYRIFNPSEGLKYGFRALALSQKIGWRKGEALANNSIGTNYLNQAAYPEALNHLFRALHIYEELGERRYIGNVEINIGAVYFGQKDYEKARDHFAKGLKAAQETGDKDGEFIAAGNIGNVYYEQGAHAKALDYMQQALRIAESLQDKRGVINQLSNIGNVYAALHDNGAALDHYSRALSIAEQEGDRQIIAANEGNIGEVYLEIAKDSSHRLSAAAKVANLAKAVSYLQKGIIDARAVHFNLAVIEFLSKLSETLTLKGDYRGALDAHLQSTALRDSTFTLENTATIAGLETMRAVQLKNKDIEIAKLRKGNERILFIAGLAVLLLIMGILFRSIKRKQHSNALLSREKKRSDDLLLNILPEEVAEELKETGRAHARQYEAVSVLFTDFVDLPGR